MIASDINKIQARDIKEKNIFVNRFFEEVTITKVKKDMINGFTIAEFDGGFFCWDNNQEISIK